MSVFGLSSDDVQYDVCILGAGISGLKTALTLTRAGYTVCVVEARDRVGGRTLTHAYKGGGTFDLGGQWLGPKQKRINALVREFGLDTVSQEWFVTLSASKTDPIVRSGAEATLTEEQRQTILRITKQMETIMTDIDESYDSMTVDSYVVKCGGGGKTYCVR
jgi:monoamine oxidase